MRTLLPSCAHCWQHVCAPEQRLPPAIRMRARPDAATLPAMNGDRLNYWICQIVLCALYVLGAWIATRFIALADQVVLIWPPAGLSFAALLLLGLRYWPFIPVGALLTHLLFDPVPGLFLPFSMASNTLGSICAVWLLGRLANTLPIEFTTRAGFTLLAAGLVQSIIGAGIGSTGLWLAHMLPDGSWWSAPTRWLLADLFGLIVVGPVTLSLLRRVKYGWKAADLALPGATRGETWLWLLALLCSLLAQVVLSALLPSNALLLSFLPAGVLMWSALRLSPLMTTAGVLVVSLTVAAYANFGMGGFTTPHSLGEIVVLLIFLSTLAVFPLTVAASQYETRRATAQLLERASTDRLTGLCNRTAFEAAASTAIEKQPRVPLALVYLDLDQFKLVNDTLGHDVGDQFLSSLAGLLASLVRPGDLLARLGGDEFAVLLRDCDAATANQWADSVVQAVERYRMGHGKHVLSSTASIGLVPLEQAGPGFQEVFARADAACSAAKELGGNRVQSSAFGDAALADREAAMHWAMRLRSAVEQEQFELYFQRILPLRGDPQGEKIEILLRLRDSQGHLLLPGRFIPALERLSLSSRLDRHVFERVISWFEQHPQASRRRIAINLSAASLADLALAESFENRLRRSTVAAQSITFEITETGVVRDLHLARSFIARMRALGCQVALDDFGAGYCSFAYLRDLPVDILKIDGSFVRELPDSALAMSVVRSMVDIARVLGMRTVAECVETQAIRDCLLALGVDHAQGIALHMPEPLEFLLRG